MTRLSVAVIGASEEGGYGHQLDQAFTENKRAKIVAVADLTDLSIAAKKARELGAERFYGSYREMLGTETPDIVVVAPRHLHRHEELVSAAIASGAHVYCEKPLARSLAEADRIISAASSAGLKLACALPWRHEPRATIVGDLIASSRFGELRTMSAACKCDPRGGGEDLFVLGHHFADMMRWIAGPAESCWATVRVDGRKAVPGDAVSGGEQIGMVCGSDIEAHYEFGGGVTGHLMSYRAGITERALHPYRMFIHGSRAIVSVRAPYADNSVWMYPEPVLRPDGPPWRRIETSAVTAYGDYHRPAGDDLIDAIVEGRDPKCSGADARDALEMILATYHSAFAGSSVELPLREREHPLR